MKRFLRRGQSGQSLVILAIGFIALVGFVGIVTDVSVLFVRYSTLRRAVDAAAVSAASQMRRIEDTTFQDVDGNGYDDIAEDEAGSVTNLNLAARSFIELYGLDPKNVIVETCRAQQVARTVPGSDPMDEAGVLLFDTDGEVNPLADAAVVDRYLELCTQDELKLVRVTAQIEAPTMFLYLLGYETVTLTESAMSQTAVLDVVLVLDVSESMLNETTYSDWEEVNLGYRYMPPAFSYAAWDDPVHEDLDENLDGCLDNDINCDGVVDYTEAYEGRYDFILKHTQAELNGYMDESLGAAWNLGIVDPYLETVDSQYRFFDPVGGQTQPREECRVRAWPNSYTVGSRVPAWLLAEYHAFYDPSDPALVTAHYSLTGATPRFYGFVPQYNYYGCCNDPDGNWDFSDLVCEPFREARDAAQGFLARLDFTRGDRVAFVTFDRYTYLVDPDGPAVDTDADGDIDAGWQEPMIETERSFTAPDPEDVRKGAVETLRQVVGVRAEPGTYLDTTNDGLWDAFRDDEGVRDADGSLVFAPAPAGDIATWADYLTNWDIGYIHDQPVRGACPFDMATAYSPYSLLADNNPNTNPDGTRAALLESVLTVPGWYPPTDMNVRRSSSYENRASCAGTNIGGGLATGSEALFRNGRREGAVWIMVLLSDGAAGASDPMARNGANVPAPPEPFYTDGLGIAQPLPASASGTDGYAVYGLCPYGVADSDPSVDADGDGILDNDGWGELLPTLWNGWYYDVSFPYCGDRHPDTRHFCTTAPVQPNRAPLDANSCYTLYDVDDYARDWADWVGLANLTGTGVGAGSGRVGEQQLPTMFTIGFGLNFDTTVGTPCGVYAAGSNEFYACQRGFDPVSGHPLPLITDASYNTRSAADQARTSDYLGEELLRYIADVGDNNRVDNDFWQWELGGRIPNAVTTDGVTVSPTADWGGRGECETDIGVQGDWAPLPPATSCGNYFSAETGSNQLEEVFNEIASRMFTRLSQ